MENDDKKIISLVKLGFWLAFIIVIVIFTKFTTTPREDNNTKTITYEQKLAKLDDNYEYKYEIKINEELYTFEGSKLNNREVGSRYINEEKIDYYIQNSYSYEIINRALILREDIFDNINTNLLDVNYIKSIIKNIEYTRDNNSYLYNLEDKEITINVDDNNITSIIINIDNNVYNLSYSNIGLVKDITY